VRKLDAGPIDAEFSVKIKLMLFNGLHGHGQAVNVVRRISE
jgi:hypothetical protein